MKTVIRFVLLCLSSVTIAGQGASASDNIAGQAGAAVPVASGQAVALNGSWKFHVGDDPQWAEPAFDDSQWEQFEMYR